MTATTEPHISLQSLERLAVLKSAHTTRWMTATELLAATALTYPSFVTAHFTETVMSLIRTGHIERRVINEPAGWQVAYFKRTR
jgi:hypothetical protein